MTEPTSTRHPPRLSRKQLEERGARFCADCGSHHEYALVEDDTGLAAYRMTDGEGRRVAEAEDPESAAQLGRVVETLLGRPA